MSSRDGKSSVFTIPCSSSGVFSGVLEVTGWSFERFGHPVTDRARTGWHIARKFHPVIAGRAVAHWVFGAESAEVRQGGLSRLGAWLWIWLGVAWNVVTLLGFGGFSALCVDRGKWAGFWRLAMIGGIPRFW